jgi:hypothetical protein
MFACRWQVRGRECMTTPLLSSALLLKPVALRRRVRAAVDNVHGAADQSTCYQLPRSLVDQVTRRRRRSAAVVASSNGLTGECGR